MDETIFLKKSWWGKIKAFSCLFLFYFVALNLSYAKTIQEDDLRGDNLLFQTTIEFQPPSSPAGFTSAEPYSAVWSANKSTYFVWVDANYRVWVTQITNGTPTTVPVDIGTDYKVQPDGHHRFSLGVDTDGYIHVTGDMHHYSNLTTAVITPYPARYQKQSILYWKSNKPHDVTGGFTFAGGLNASTAIPGGGWMLGRFFADNNGVLYYSSMVHAYEASNNAGQNAVGLYRYNTATKTWSAIGAKAPITIPNMINVFPVFYWELSGLNTNGVGNDNWFQNHQPSFKFDKDNRLHFALTTNTNHNAYGANRLLYAVSPDSGLSWQKANGTRITGLPLRGIDGLPATADVVANSDAAPGLGASPGLIVDKNGMVGLSVDSVWRVWDGNTWNKNTKQNITGFYTGNYGYRLPNNDLLIVSGSTSKVMATTSFNNSPLGYDYLGYNGLVDLDDYGLRTTGEIHAVALTGQDKQTLLKTTISEEALPDGWKGKDIWLDTPSYLGSASFKDGTFVINNYGKAIENQNDSLYFVYKKMSGDGEFSARVVDSSLSTPLKGYARLGIMMRNSLAANSAEVGTILAPGTDNKGALFNVRPVTNAWSYASANASIKTTPYWVKLVRKGNVFTGYTSPDGINWTLLQTATVAMNKDIYVGMVAASYAHGYVMATATFDNVTAPVAFADNTDSNSY